MRIASGGNKLIAIAQLLGLLAGAPRVAFDELVPPSRGHRLAADVHACVDFEEAAGERSSEVRQ